MKGIHRMGLSTKNRVIIIACLPSSSCSYLLHSLLLLDWQGGGVSLLDVDSCHESKGGQRTGGPMCVHDGNHVKYGHPPMSHSYALSRMTSENVKSSSVKRNGKTSMGEVCSWEASEQSGRPNIYGSRVCFLGL
jgi:hypothetical protein